MSTAVGQPMNHRGLLTVYSATATWTHPGSLRGNDAQETPWDHPRDGSPFLALLASL